MRPRVAVALLVLASVLGLPAAASAVSTRYASPDGSGTACTSAAPCTLDQAIDHAASQDTVIVKSGTYTELQAIYQPLTVYVKGQTPRPVINFGPGGSGDMTFTGAGTTVQNLDINDPSVGTFALYVSDFGSLISHVSAHGTLAGCAIGGDNSLVSDSVCTATVESGLVISTGSPVKVRNVTAIGSKYGIEAIGAAGNVDGQVVNTIARGGTGASDADVYAAGQASAASATLTLDHSDFATIRADSYAVITPESGNQSAPPLFVNAAAGDLREAPGSPTIDAGSTAIIFFNDTDLDGNPRTIGSAPDIGAYEFNPPVVTTRPATDVKTTAARLNGTIASHGYPGAAQFELGRTSAYGTVVPAGQISASSAATPVSRAVTRLIPGIVYHYRLDLVVGPGTVHGADQTFRTAPVAPVVSALKLSPSSFTAANTGPTIAAAVGTKVSFRLDQTAAVSFSVKRTQPGVRKGLGCVAPPRKRHGRRPKSCTRYANVRGGFTFNEQPGAHSFRFMGRLRGHSLKQGSYVLYAVARDLAGLKSKPAGRRFKIVR